VIHRHNKDKNGFTLLEVLIAMAILSIGLLALAGLQVVVIKGNASSKNLTSAVILAEAKLEELKRGGFTNLRNGNDTHGIFTRSWVITAHPDHPDSEDIRQITVTLTWTDSLGSHTIPITTVFSRAVD